VTSSPLPNDGWLLLIYHVPPEPSNNRVSVWRELKRLGALYLQQCACVLPALPACVQGVASVTARITSLGGSYHLFQVRELAAAEEAKLIAGFRELSAKEYDEILEECRTKFIKEIEFERFRANYTYEEAEEIREDLEKIRRWYARVVERDWFDAGQREAVARELEQCERLLEAFEAEVYHRTGQDQGLFAPAPSPATASTIASLPEASPNGAPGGRDTAPIEEAGAAAAGHRRSIPLQRLPAGAPGEKPPPSAGRERRPRRRRMPS
jgi:hypothetical protein